MAYEIDLITKSLRETSEYLFILFNNDELHLDVQCYNEVMKILTTAEMALKRSTTLYKLRRKFH